MRHKTSGKLYLGHKIAAVFVAISFTLFNIFAYSPSAFANQRITQVIARNTDDHVDFTIPTELGTVEEFHQGTSDKTIIYIQDAHDSLEAQENIAKIIHYLVEQHAVKTVFEEGYEGEVPTEEFFGFIPEPDIKEKVAYFLMDKLRISGAEYAHINRTKDFKLIGADDIDLHLENIGWYQKSAQAREETEEDLKRILNEIRQLMNRYFPKELKSWLKQKERFNENKLDLLDYLKRTSEIYLKASSEQLFVEQFPLASLILTASGSKEKEVLEKLNAIDSKSLFLELEALEKFLVREYLHSQRDQQFFSYYKALNLLMRLNEIEISQTEYGVVKETLKTLNTKDVADFIVKHTGKSIVLSKLWEKTIQPAINFYETAGKRDGSVESRIEYFLESSEEKTAVLVFGGFHKPNIREILHKKSISYHIVTPKITSISERHRNYYKRLMSIGHHPFEIPTNVAVAAATKHLWVMNDGVTVDGRTLVLGVYRGVWKQNKLGISDKALWMRGVEDDLQDGLLVSATQGKQRSEVRTDNQGEEANVRSSAWQERMAKIDLEAAPLVLRHYNLEQVSAIVPTMGGVGEHGKSLRITAGQEDYILKPMTTAIFPELLEGARYEVSVVNKLVQEGVAVASLQPTTKVQVLKDEDRFLVEADNGKIYLLYRVIRGQELTHEDLNEDQFYSFINTLATIHRSLMNFTPTGQRSRPSIMDFSVQKDRLRLLRRIILKKRKDDPSYVFSRGETFFINNVEFILEQLSLLESNTPPALYTSLPRTQVHGDYHPGNVIFQGNQITGVFDWDHLREEAKVYDFFHGLFQNVTPDQRFNVEGLIKAVSRYEETLPLTDLERQVLPEMARLKYLDLLTWIVRPEKLAERHMYDLSNTDSLQQAVAILDRNDGVFAWFRGNIAVLRDIHERIEDGSFDQAIRRSEIRSSHKRSELQAPSWNAPVDLRVTEAVRQFDTPVLAFMDADNLTTFSPVQIEEVFASAYQKRSELRLVIYNADPTDAQFRHLGELDNVSITKASAPIAFETYGRNFPRKAIHFSKGDVDLRDEFDSHRKRLDFFRTQGEESGSFWVSLLYSISDGNLPGVGRDSDGFLSIVDAYLLAQVQQYHANLIVSWAA